MTVEQLILKLAQYNHNAKVDVIANNKSYEFSMAYGNTEGCAKRNCASVSFYVDDLNQSESAR